MPLVADPAFLVLLMLTHFGPTLWPWLLALQPAGGFPPSGAGAAALSCAQSSARSLVLNPSWLSLKTVGYLGGKKWGGVAHGASDRCFLLSVLLLEHCW